VLFFFGSFTIPFTLASGQNNTEQMGNVSDKQILCSLPTANSYADDIQAGKKWYSKLLGIEPYFARPDSELPASIEFRIDDYQHERGIIDSKYSPRNVKVGPGGEIFMGAEISDSVLSFKSKQNDRLSFPNRWERMPLS
jgi:hypothetical protein